ncbi:MAG: cell envelope integrity protein CreD [Gammaproteobacteria bacterium]|jgi:inner membrane protein
MNINELGKYCNESHVGRALLVTLLIMLLQIPAASIEQMVVDRKATQKQAINDIQKKWGQTQKIIGPLLVVPYEKKGQWQYQHSADKIKSTNPGGVHFGRAVFLPENLEVINQLSNESRYRGLFDVPLYQADITMSGYFSKPRFDDWGIPDEDVLWKKARLVVLVSDARAIQKQARLSWNGKDYFFEPGTDAATLDTQGYHVEFDGFDEDKDKYSFTTQLKLNGSESLYVAPLGKDSLIAISAPWPDPSFQGKWLPSSREVSESGFNAQWQIPYLGRNFSQKTQQFSNLFSDIQTAVVGVDLIFPVDNYRMSERSIKYQLLFLVLTFTAIWLIELIAKLRVHIMQYLFIGAGLCVFYLLELSLSEHLGFYLAYFIATVAIVVMISAYSLVMLHTGKRAAIIGASLSALYLYLFTLLQEQNYALVIGSLGLFFMLAVVMYATRKIDWFKVTQIPVFKTQTAESA